MHDNRAARRFLFAGALLVIMAVWPVLYVNMTQARQADHNPEVSLFAHPAFAHTAETNGAGTIADVAERAVDSVVNIAASNGQGGSGVIVSDDGLVITNNHVIRRARRISVTTADGREFKATVVGQDRASDLAVLRLSGDIKNLTPMVIGDSKELRLGEIVLAIGNPMGVGQTVTMGIVSAKDRQGFIQTDAAINPGNSGGALVNLKGELVGINSFILSKSGGNQGLGFAIPSNTVEPIVGELLQDGQGAWLGVTIQTVDRQVAARFDLAATTGVLVTGVMRGSPADQAGLEPYDVIQKFAGKKVDSVEELKRAVAAGGVGTKVEVRVHRGDLSKKLRVKLITRESASAIRR